MILYSVINLKTICSIQTAALRAVERRSILSSGVMLTMIKAVVILCDYGDYMLHESKLGFTNKFNSITVSTVNLSDQKNSTHN